MHKKRIVEKRGENMKEKRNLIITIVGILLMVTVACNFSASTANVKSAFTARMDNGEVQQTTVFTQEDVFLSIVDVANAPDDTITKAMWYAVDAEGVEPNYFLAEAQVEGGGELTFDLSNNDLLNLKNYFSNQNDFLYLRDVYEKEERNKKDIRYPGLALAEELEFHGFIGVPLSYRPDDAKFRKVIYQDYNDKKIYVPAIIVEAIKNEFKRILREAENRLRIKRGLPKIGEGWISETDLYYKIKEAFPSEKIIHHGRPKWIGRQHLDVFFPKKNIGIEYQGAQHDVPIEYFGGEEAFEKRKTLDALKKEKCEKNGCHLIYVYPDYDFRELEEKIKNLI